MSFSEIHDLALINLRQEAIKIIEDFEGKNISDKNYHKKLNNLLNKKIGKKVETLTKISLSTTIKGLDFENRKV